MFSSGLFLFNYVLHCTDPRRYWKPDWTWPSHPVLVSGLNHSVTLELCTAQGQAAERSGGTRGAGCFWTCHQSTHVKYSVAFCWIGASVGFSCLKKLCTTPHVHDVKVSFGVYRAKVFCIRQKSGLCFSSQWLCEPSSVSGGLSTAISDFCWSQGPQTEQGSVKGCCFQDRKKKGKTSSSRKGPCCECLWHRGGWYRKDRGGWEGFKPFQLGACSAVSPLDGSRSVSALWPQPFWCLKGQHQKKVQR